jgi:hypothetical protein
MPDIGALKIVTSVLSLFLLCIYVPSGASITQLSPEAKEYLLKEDSLKSISRVEEIPPAVFRKLAEMIKDPNLKLAEPWEKYQSTDVITEEGLPYRKLIWGGVSKDYCLIHYVRGGIGRSYKAVLFKRSANDASFLWGAWSINIIKNLSEFRDLLKAGSLDAGTYDGSRPFSW